LALGSAFPGFLPTATAGHAPAFRADHAETVPFAQVFDLDHGIRHGNQTVSMNVFSTRLNRITPMATIARVIRALNKRFPASKDPLPRNAYRKVSMTAVMGLASRNGLNRADTVLRGYTTGVAYIASWTPNVTRKRKSVFGGEGRHDDAETHPEKRHEENKYRREQDGRIGADGRARQREIRHEARKRTN